MPMIATAGLTLCSQQLRKAQDGEWLYNDAIASTEEQGGARRAAAFTLQQLLDAEAQAPACHAQLPRLLSVVAEMQRVRDLDPAGSEADLLLLLVSILQHLDADDGNAEELAQAAGLARSLPALLSYLVDRRDTLPTLLQLLLRLLLIILQDVVKCGRMDGSLLACLPELLNLMSGLQAPEQPASELQQHAAACSVMGYAAGIICSGPAWLPPGMPGYEALLLQWLRTLWQACTTPAMLFVDPPLAAADGDALGDALDMAVIALAHASPGMLLQLACPAVEALYHAAAAQKGGGGQLPPAVDKWVRSWLAAKSLPQPAAAPAASSSSSSRCCVDQLQACAEVVVLSMGSAPWRTASTQVLSDVLQLLMAMQLVAGQRNLRLVVKAQNALDAVLRHVPGEHMPLLSRLQQPLIWLHVAPPVARCLVAASSMDCQRARISLARSVGYSLLTCTPATFKTVYSRDPGLCSAGFQASLHWLWELRGIDATNRPAADATSVSRALAALLPQQQLKHASGPSVVSQATLLLTLLKMCGTAWLPSAIRISEGGALACCAAGIVHASSSSSSSSWPPAGGTSGILATRAIALSWARDGTSAATLSWAPLQHEKEEEVPRRTVTFTGGGSSSNGRAGYGAWMAVLGQCLCLAAAAAAEHELSSCQLAVEWLLGYKPSRAQLADIGGKLRARFALAEYCSI
ncbi:hypothetical protein COO60DRAFT_1643864 [Scenedesmus sp. NREL 46B-D3]|nr:hypothetical protein COO60DRAFT_1643864 [Scenedesmus sp. NREL 46B-D3]